MIEVPAGLIALAKPWAEFYGDHTGVSNSVTALHLLGMLIGGGAAVTLDRETLAALQTAAGDAALLPRLRRTHRWVLLGLGLLTVTGVLQTLSDLKTFLPAGLFWVKVGLFVLLLGNGAVLLRGERAAAEGRWGLLRGTALASLILWISLLVVGVFLTSVA